MIRLQPQNFSQETELSTINRYQKILTLSTADYSVRKILSVTLKQYWTGLISWLFADGAGMTNIERNNIAIEISERLPEIASLTNSQDENGDYIYSGFRNSQPAFILEEGQYRYQGDEGFGMRESQKSQLLLVPIMADLYLIDLLLMIMSRWWKWVLIAPGLSSH